MTHAADTRLREYGGQRRALDAHAECEHKQRVEADIEHPRR